LQEQLVVELGDKSQDMLALLLQSPKSDAKRLHEAMEVENCLSK
jgi:uncharacterized protein (DUF1778 family)